MLTSKCFILNCCTLILIVVACVLWNIISLGLIRRPSGGYSACGMNLIMDGKCSCLVIPNYCLMCIVSILCMSSMDHLWSVILYYFCTVCRGSYLIFVWYFWLICLSPFLSGGQALWPSSRCRWTSWCRPHHCSATKRSSPVVCSRHACRTVKDQRLQWSLKYYVRGFIYSFKPSVHDFIMACWIQLFLS
jgi:hypothetical protein